MISFSLLILIIFGAAAMSLTVTRHRPGLAVVAVVAVGALVLMLFFLGLGFTHVSHPVAEQVPTPDWSIGPMSHAPTMVQVQEVNVPAPQNFTNVNVNGNRTQVTWSISIIKLLMFVGLIGFLVVLVFRRLFSPHACGHRKAWPLIVLVPILIVFFIRGSVRYQSQSSQSPQVAVQSFLHRPQPTSTGQNSRLAQQRASVQAKDKKLKAQIQNTIGPPDIHDEMDKFDGPRIPLPPDPQKPDTTVVPPAPLTSDTLVAVATQSIENTSDAETTESKESATATDAKPESKSKDGEAAKKPANSNRKRKKSDKPTNNASSKAAKAVAETKPSETPDDAKDTSAENEKSTKVAESPPAAPHGSRPAWTNEPRGRKGNTYREVIETDPYESPDECYQAADVYLLLKTYQRMQELAGRPYTETKLPSLTFRNGAILGDGNAPLFFTSYGGKNPTWVDPRLLALSEMGITIDFLRREIMVNPKNDESREFVETVDHSFGPMKKLYRQIEFTPATDRQLMQHWDAYQRRERFAVVGVGAGSILGLLAVAFALLKFDTMTKGYYTKRLFIGVPLAILGLFGLYGMLLKMGFNLPH